MLKNALLTLFIVTAIGGCAIDPTAVTDDDDVDETPAGTSQDEVVIHEDVVILDEDPCLMSVDVPEDRETLVFEFSCDPAISGIEPGKIVVGSAGGGFLRRVVSAEIDGPIVTAFTEEASLNEAVIQGDLHVSMGEAERALIDLGNTTLYGDQLFGSFTLFRLEEASLDITPLLDIDGHWEDGRVDTFEMDASLRLAGALSVLLSTTNGLRYSDSFQVWEGSLPFSAAIGPLPVVGQLGIKTGVGYMLDAPGHMTATVSVRGVPTQTAIGIAHTRPTHILTRQRNQRNTTRSAELRSERVVTEDDGPQQLQINSQYLQNRMNQAIIAPAIR